MTDIRTITQEFSTSGSLSEVQVVVETSTMDSHTHETVQFLVKKIDELIAEVNTLKNQ
jgi:hypothetical protein